MPYGDALNVHTPWIPSEHGRRRRSSLLRSPELSWASACRRSIGRLRPQPQPRHRFRHQECRSWQSEPSSGSCLLPPEACSASRAPGSCRRRRASGRPLRPRTARAGSPAAGSAHTLQGEPLACLGILQEPLCSSSQGPSHPLRRLSPQGWVTETYCGSFRSGTA